MEDEFLALARGVEAEDDALLLILARAVGPIVGEAREVDGGEGGVEGACGADHGAVDGFGAPDEVGAVVEGEEARGQLAGADHGGEDELAAVVDAISRDGDPFGSVRHDRGCEA